MKNSLILCSILLCIGCAPEEDYTGIHLINNSNDTVYWYCNQDTYPDTIGAIFNIHDINGYIAYPNKRDIFYHSYIAPEDTVMIFIYSDSVFKKHTLQQIYEGYMVLARYDLSYYDLEYLNYKISYPPSEKMMGMKMYTPKK
jgi:hypothetical protein